MVTVHVEVKRPWRSRRVGSLDGSRAAETGASGVSRAPDTDGASALCVVLGWWWQKNVCGVPTRRLLVASKRRLLQDERTKSSVSTGESVDEDDRTCGRALRVYPGVNTSCLARSWDTSISPSNCKRDGHLQRSTRQKMKNYRAQAIAVNPLHCIHKQSPHRRNMQ